MTQTPFQLRQLAGALDELAEVHSAEARNFSTLGLPELSLRATGRALTLRAAQCELLLLVHQEEDR